MSDEGSYIPKVNRIQMMLGAYPILGDVMRERMREELFRRGIITRQRFEEEVRERAVASQRREGVRQPVPGRTGGRLGAPAGQDPGQPDRVLLGLQPQPAALRGDRARGARPAPDRREGAEP